MKNKGFIRTLEAIIAIVLVLGFIYLISQNEEKPIQTPQPVKQSLSLILQTSSTNSTFRNCIKNISPSQFGNCKDISGCMASLYNFTEKNIPPGYDFLCEVCGSSISCLTQNIIPREKSIFTDSILIAHNPGRVFRVYFWEK